MRCQHGRGTQSKRWGCATSEAQGGLVAGRKLVVGDPNSRLTIEPPIAAGIHGNMHTGVVLKEGHTVPEVYIFNPLSSVDFEGCIEDARGRRKQRDVWWYALIQFFIPSER